MFFFIMWGFRVRSRVLEHGTFFCPHDGVDRPYTRREARRWFTLFFIPIIPLKVLGEFIECEGCHNKFDERVLSLPTSSQMSEQLSNALRIAVAILVRESANSPATRDAAIAAVRGMGTDYDDSSLDIDVNGADATHLEGWVRHLADALTVQGKEQLLSAIVRVALADGSLDDIERRFIDGVGRDLLMTPAHVTGIVAQTQSSPTT